MGETPVMFYMIGNQTTDVKGIKTIHLKTTDHEKSHFNDVLSCLEDGTELKPMVIFKIKTLPKCIFPNGVFINAHVKGWVL